MTTASFLVHFCLFCLLTSTVVAATRHDEPAEVIRDAVRLFAIFVGSVIGVSLVLMLFEL